MTTIREVSIPTPRFPIECNTNAPSHRPAGMSTSARAEPRVLVIDDESALCELLSLYLGHKGLEVATVQRVGEARAIVERGQFDLVLLDWKLDGVEGLDLLHLSKALHPDIPVIIYTGADLNEGSLGSGLAREADAVIPKMGPLDALSTAIFRHLDQRQAGLRKAS
jgi:DNA-binding response OmpR family regulator